MANTRPVDYPDEGFSKRWPHSDDEKSHSKEIHELRTALSEFSLQNQDQELIWEINNDDRACVRFLRARQFKVKKSADMVIQAVNIRKSQFVDRTLDGPFPHAFEFNKLLMRGWHGYDRHGRPIYIERMGQVDLDAVWAKMDDNERLAYCRYQAEYIRKVIFPRASARAGHRIDQLCIVIDMLGTGRHQFRPRQYSFVKNLSNNDQIIYPERMAVTLIVNAPRIFALVWRVVSGWMDQAMKEKIKIVSSNGHKELVAMIEPDQLPAVLGGTCKCCGDDKFINDKAMHWDPNGCMMYHPIMNDFFEFCKTGFKNDTSAKAVQLPQEEVKLGDIESVTAEIDKLDLEKKANETTAH